jgi:hypothetical protein
MLLPIKRRGVTSITVGYGFVHNDMLRECYRAACEAGL